jgi:metal-responsive CopG/Arc/MetJ family transcriptional regulator
MCSNLRYNRGMKVKTSITLSDDLLEAIAQVAPEQNRSEFIENAVRAKISAIRRQSLNARDLAIIDANAERLNAEAADVLEFQRAF